MPQINNHFFKSIFSWDDFVSSLLPLSKKEKGDAFELLTKCFFWEMAIELGSETLVGEVDVTAGFDGGALAMGLITCMCIFGVVWLQINKTKP